MGVLFRSPMRRSVRVSWESVGTPLRMVLRRERYCFHSGWFLPGISSQSGPRGSKQTHRLSRSVPFLMTGSPKMAKPTRNPRVLIIVWDERKRKVKSMGDRHDVRISLGRRTGKGGVGLRALAKRSYTSIICSRGQSAWVQSCRESTRTDLSHHMHDLLGLAKDHVGDGLLGLVLLHGPQCSCLVLGLGYICEVSARMSSTQNSQCNSPFGFWSPANPTASVMTEFTKLWASCSTASPSLFSGAPVTDPSDANTPAIGFFTPFPSPLIIDGGAGGKHTALHRGTITSPIAHRIVTTPSKSAIHAAAYTARNAPVRLDSLHDRSRTMCFQAVKAPTTTVMYSRSRCVLNLTGVKVSSGAISRSRPDGGGTRRDLTWHTCLSKRRTRAHSCGLGSECGRSGAGTAPGRECQPRSLMSRPCPCEEEEWG